MKDDLVEQLEWQVSMSPRSSYYNPDKYMRLAAAEIKRLRAAAVGADVGAGWRPIETAPKDGTEILGWVKWRTGSMGACVVSWDKSQGWIDQDEWDQEVLAWCPLPAPPVGTDVRADGRGAEKSADTSAT